MAATMKDVAKLAGVSLGTVSRVVNHARVKEKTKDKVESAINELAYIPDDYARGLKTNRSMFVALILPSIWHPFFSEFAYYVETELTKRGVQVTDLFVPEPITNLDELLRRLFVRNPSIDGIFCVIDTMLMDVRNFLIKHGKRVPEDIQLIGYDGIALGPTNDLGLSTIVQPVSEMAQAAVNALFVRIENPEEPTQIKILPISYKEGTTTRNL